MLRFQLLAPVFLATTLASVAYADARSDARQQVEFGVSVAQRGLWKEALYRWQRAVEIDPTYAEAYNNIAIAQEHEGKLSEAREAYEKALKIAPNNSTIRQNYEDRKSVV